MRPLLRLVCPAATAAVLVLGACSPSEPANPTLEAEAATEGSAASATDEAAAATDETTDETAATPDAEADAGPIRVTAVTEADACAQLRRDLLGPSGAPIESIDLDAAREALTRGGDDRGQVLERLLGGGSDASALVGDLTPLLNDGDTGTRRAAWAALAANDPAALVDTARPILRDPNAQLATRDEAARGLAMTGRAGLAVLTIAAREEDPALRAIARSGLRTALSWPLAARDVLFADGAWCAEPTDAVCVELARGIAQADPEWLARRAVTSVRFRVLALEYASMTDEAAPATWEQTIRDAGMTAAERLESARIIAGYGHPHAAARVAAGALLEGLESTTDQQIAARLVLDGADGLGDDADDLVAFAESGVAGSLFVAAALYRATGGVHATPARVNEVIGTPSDPEREVAIAIAAVVGTPGFDVETAPLADDERAFATALRDRDAEALVQFAPRMAHQYLVDRGLVLYLSGDDSTARIDALIEALAEDESPADRWLLIGARLGDAGAPFAPLAIGRALDRVPDPATARWWDAYGGRDALVAAIEEGLGSGHLATRRRALILAGVLGVAPEQERLLNIMTAGAHAVQLETGDLRRLAAGLVARNGAPGPIDALALRARFSPGMPGHVPAGLVAMAALTHCDAP